MKHRDVSATVVECRFGLPLLLLYVFLHMETNLIKSYIVCESVKERKK